MALQCVHGTWIAASDIMLQTMLTVKVSCMPTDERKSV